MKLSASRRDALRRVDNIGVIAFADVRWERGETGSFGFLRRCFLAFGAFDCALFTRETIFRLLCSFFLVTPLTLCVFVGLRFSTNFASFLERLFSIAGNALLIVTTFYRWEP
jgi:hypothetical protein